MGRAYGDMPRSSMSWPVISERSDQRADDDKRNTTSSSATHQERSSTDVVQQDNSRESG